MRYLVILFAVLVSCNDHQNQVVIDQVNYTVSDLQLQQSVVELTGEALKKSLEWSEYQAFVTSMENYDHSKAATGRLLETTGEMVENPDHDFKNLPILSRVKVLETRVGVLASYLGYTVKTAEQHQQKFNDAITAWDELKKQMNFKFNEIDKTRQELLDQLRNEERIDAEKERRDSIVRDSL